MRLIVIVLLVSILAVVNNIDLSRPDDLSDRQALSFNWFKYWRKKPVMPTPVPVMTPKHEPINMTEYKPVITPKYKPAITPTPTSIPARKWLIFPQTTSTPMVQPAPNLNQQFK